MSRRLVVVSVLSALMAPFALASEDAADRVCIRESVVRVGSPRLELARLFTFDAAPSVETEDGVSAPMGSMEVVVARIGPDGKLVYGCVDSEEGVRKFLEAPVEKLRNSKVPQEQ